MPNADTLTAESRRSLRTMALGFLMLFVAASGCCTLSRRCANDEENIAAREQGQLGMQSMQSGKLGEADARLSHAIKKCPDDVRLRHSLATLRRKQGRMDDAVAEMEKAVDLAGGEPEWLAELASMQFAEGEYENAWNSTERALQQQPSLAAAWHVRGEVLKQGGNLNEALREYHRALAVDGADEEQQSKTLMQVADIYRLQSRPRRALSTLQRLSNCSREHQPPELTYAKALAYQALSRHEEAIEQFEQARTVYGNQPPLLAQLAVSLWQVGDAVAARNTLQTAAELDPADPLVQRLSAEWQTPSESQPQVATAR